MGSLRGVRALPARATGGRAASSGRGGRCAIDPPNGQHPGQDGEASRRRTTTRSCRPRVFY